MFNVDDISTNSDASSVGRHVINSTIS